MNLVSSNYEVVGIDFIFVVLMENSHAISLQEAMEMVQRYANNSTFINHTRACEFPISVYNEIMNQEGCNSIRSYFAMNNENQLTLILVGVDAQGNDMVDGKLMDFANLCPLNCDTNSPLLI